MNVRTARLMTSVLGGTCAVLVLIAILQYAGFGRGYSWSPDAESSEEHAPLAGKLADEYLMAGHARVAAGGVDTSKAIIARRLLGLPNALENPKPADKKKA